MASQVAIASTCEGIVRLLRSNFDPADFNNATLDFQVYVADNFLQPMDQGVSVLLYRIYHNCSHRTPPGRIVNGQGADTDIVVASAKAYINALNKLHSRLERLNPQV